MKVAGMLFSAALVLSLIGWALGQTTTDLNNQVTTMNTLTASQGESKPVSKISGDFNSFLGSDANAVVTGLRNGTPITLTSTTTTPGSTPASPSVTTTTINPPTGKMGFGNVYISLALAKQQLSTMGITNPTHEQLQAALTGGTITMTSGTGTTATTTKYDLQGVLTMRSQNMGWGQIAHKLGFKLGPVISRMKSANHSLASTTTSSTGSGQSSSSTSSGVVSGSGKGHTGNGNSKHGTSDGIVTGSGRSAGGAGRAYGQGKGIVTGAGHAGGAASGISSAGGHGSGQGKGHDK
jgi:hypothetical protein